MLLFTKDLGSPTNAHVLFDESLDNLWDNERVLYLKSNKSAYAVAIKEIIAAAKCNHIV